MLSRSPSKYEEGRVRIAHESYRCMCEAKSVFGWRLVPYMKILDKPPFYTARGNLNSAKNGGSIIHDL